MKFLILLGVVSYTLGAVVIVQKNVCPDAESIAPCSCKNVAFGLQVVCSDIHSTFVLRRIFQVLCDYDIDSLVLNGLNFPSAAPSNLFDGMKVNSLRLENSQLSFEGPMFDGLGKSLTNLNVAKSAITDGTMIFRLALLEGLLELQVQHNKLAYVDKLWLKSVPNLDFLILDHNELKKIDDEAFHLQTKIKHISLADNTLSSIHRNMLPNPAPKLLRIDLSYNMLSSLPSDIFVGMPSLREVVMSGNQLKSIPKRTWSLPWSSLNTVLLFENPLQCDEKLDWIKKRKRPTTLEGECAGPENKTGQSLRRIYGL